MAQRQCCDDLNSVFNYSAKLYNLTQNSTSREYYVWREDKYYTHSEVEGCAYMRGENQSQKRARKLTIDERDLFRCGTNTHTVYALSFYELSNSIYIVSTIEKREIFAGYIRHSIYSILSRVQSPHTTSGLHSACLYQKKYYSENTYGMHSLYSHMNILSTQTWIDCHHRFFCRQAL